jgi:hypothetical protein
MEGNYHFTWNAVSATGEIEGPYEQTIYAESLAAACARWWAQSGPDENGVCMIITSIEWQP